MRHPFAIGAAGLGAALILMLALPGAPARAQSDGTFSGSSSREELLYRLDLLAAEMADIRARLGGLPGGGQGVTAFPNAGNSGAIETELRRLTAQVERLENDMRTLSGTLTQRLGDIEFRLNELEGGGSGTASAPIPLLQDDGGITIESDTGPAAPAGERSDLDLAIEDVNQGRFDQAEDRLQRFLAGNRGSTLVGEAWYWLGESQFVRGDRVQAAKSYLNGYNANKRGYHAPHNLYRLGVALGRLGQLNEACITLREMRRQFPSAPDGLGAKADEESDQLACT